jgi:RNA polymerase sigma-70 factor (ECF subfamily)
MGQTWEVGDQAGFLACYDAAFPEVYRYAARLCGDRQRAEDLVHDVFVATLRRARGGELPAIGIGWLCQAVRNRFLDGIRAEQREQRRLRIVSSRGVVVASEPDECRSLLAGLSHRERAAVVLRYVDDLPVAEVAEALGLSLRATESLLARARARVRRSLRSEVRDA